MGAQQSKCLSVPREQLLSRFPPHFYRNGQHIIAPIYRPPHIERVRDYALSTMHGGPGAHRLYVDLAPGRDRG